LKTGTNIIKYAVPLCLLLFTACADFVYRTVTVNQLTVTFDSQGGTECGEIVTKYGAAVVLPETDRPEYIFSGWHSDPVRGVRLGRAGDEYVVRNSITMYARWVRDLEVSGGDSVINGIPAVRVSVEAATFIMGSPPSEAGRYFDEVQREVTISKGYWISKYPVTNFQFGKTVPYDQENHPVTGVTWQEALDYAVSKGGNLPTEAQWEFAARGGNMSRGHIYSGSDVLGDVGWYEGNAGGQTNPTGQKQPNELGIHDMSGNVFEWCADWYGYHTEEPITDPTGPTTGPGRISRGGAWDRPARDGRVADRAYSDPYTPNDNIGFRIVFTTE